MRECYPPRMAARRGNGEGATLTTKILVQIRDELRDTKEEVKKTNERLDQTNERLGRLERRQTEDAVRLATELVGVAHLVGEVRDLLKDQKIDRRKLEDHERRIAKLEKRSA